MNWEQFKTHFDKMPVNIARRQEARAKGLKTGQDATEFHIAVNSVWSTTNKDGSSTFAYERLGYHANTAYFFQGILESGVEIIDHRR